MVNVRENHGSNSVKRLKKKKKRERTTVIIGGCFNKLPCEILQNIALMLPFSSIIRLKRSSKFWYDLLTDPKFVDLHLNHSVLRKPHGYLFNAYVKDDLACFYMEQSAENRLTASKMFEYPIDSETRFQSSGGLMFIYDEQSMSCRIFNPHVPREEIHVPCDSRFIKKSCSRHYFGYSPSTKEYKILHSGELLLDRGKTVFALIYTLGSNIWREIIPNDYVNKVQDNSDSPPTECQGNLFWIGDSSDSNNINNNNNVVWFDIVSEIFHEIPPPPYDPNRIDRMSIDKRLTFTCLAYVRDRLISMGDTIGYIRGNILWTLEDKINGVWINRYDFSIPSSFTNVDMVGISENWCLLGNMKGYYLTQFFSHDMGRGTGLKVVKLRRRDKRVGEGAVKHVEYIVPHVGSFVSPVKILKH